MAQPIMTLIKTRPVGRKDNLQMICKELNIKFDEKNDSNAVLQANIATHTQNFPDSDAHVRLLAKDMIDEFKQIKSTENSQAVEKAGIVDLTSPTQTVADSQIPLVDEPTQPTATTAPPTDTPAPIEKSPIENDLKRKLNESENSDDLDDFMMENKRQKTLIEDLLQTLKDERTESKKERAESKRERAESQRERAELKMALDNISVSLETGNKLKEKYFTEKFEQVDVAFQVISDKTNETLTTVKNVQKELSKINTKSPVNSTPLRATLPLTPTAPPFIPSVPSHAPTLWPSAPPLPMPVTRGSNSNNGSNRSSNNGRNIGSNNRCSSGSNSSSNRSISSEPASPRRNIQAKNVLPNSPKPYQREKKSKLLLITDSNGSDLNVDTLKPESSGTKFRRSTTKSANTYVPKIKDPEQVTDIVFQVGLNDFRDGDKPEIIQENYLDMQMSYSKIFPNARQHICAIPPLQNGHNKVNEQLQKLSAYTQTNFVSTKEFKDINTGKIRPNLMKDFVHYNDWGVKILAKQIKKSLYSTANIGSKQLENMCRISEVNPEFPEPMEIESTVTSSPSAASASEASPSAVSQSSVSPSATSPSATSPSATPPTSASLSAVSPSAVPLSVTSPNVAPSTPADAH